MNRLYFGLSTLALTSLAIYSAHAQSVGIGTSSPDSKAALDISAGAGNDRGLLIPRMTYAQRTNITTTTEGMLVYQTDDQQPGFWYFTNGAWVALLSSAAGWTRTGNAGTDPGTNPGVDGSTPSGTSLSFLGTTDGKDLAFRTNNGERLRITTNGTLYSHSSFGLVLDGRDTPMLTRGWDPFKTGDYAGIGRWGVFMRASQLTFGIPNLGGKSFGWATWDNDSNVNATLMTLTQGGNLGIGLTNPSTRLSLTGSGAPASPATVNTSQSTGHLARFRDNGNVTLDLGSSGATAGMWLQSTNATDLSTNYPLRLNPNGGYVGVGTAAPQSTLEVNGSLAGNYRSITATGTTTLAATDFVVVYTGSEAATFILPSGLSAKGRLYTIKNATASQTLTLNTTNSETIAGSTSLSIPAGQSVQVVTTGAATGTATYELVAAAVATTAPVASNGLTATSGTIRLGGPLTAATDVATAGNNLTFSGTGRFGFGTTSINGLFNVSGAMGSSYTGGLNLTNTSGTSTTLSITPGYAGTTGATGAVATYDLPGVGNQIFGDNVLPDGNANSLGNGNNRWATIYGTNGNFTGSMKAGVSNPGSSNPATSLSITAGDTDYFVVTKSVVTYTLPLASANVGRTLIIYAFGGTATINVGSGSTDTIYAPDNFAKPSTTTYTLTQYHRITFMCDGTNWISTAYL